MKSEKLTLLLERTIFRWVEIVKDKATKLSKGFAFFNVRTTHEANTLKSVRVKVRGRNLQC